MSEFIMSDNPIDCIGNDALDLSSAASALVDFIRMSDTPLTISVQGEWGTGKTSLLKMMESKLINDPKMNTIMIDSWEHFLGNTTQGNAEQIIVAIINSLTQLQSSTPAQKLATTGRALQNFLAKSAGVAASLKGGDGQMIIDTLHSQVDVVSELRKAIADLIDANNTSKFVIFIDNLDRVEPASAVEVLEMLKNIFSVNNCIFIIAIDFNVVSSGLEQKYPSLSRFDEHLHRDYFDKIFQFSYIVPTNPRLAKRMIQDGLDKIGYFTSEDHTPLQADILNVLIEIVSSNPRKIKRFINSIHYRMLVDAYNNNYLHNGSFHLRAINAIIVALTIICPDFVRQLYSYPNFAQPSSKTLRAIAPNLSSKDFEESFSWEQYYRVALSASPYASLTDIIILALRKIEDLLEQDGHIAFSVVLGLSQFISPSIGDVGIEEKKFTQYVSQPYRYGTRLLAQFHLPQHAHVLHLSCQDGAITLKMLQENPSITIDATNTQENLYQATLQKLNTSNIDPRRYTIQLCQIDDIEAYQAYDIVFSVAAIHWRGKGAYLKIFDALKPSGWAHLQQNMANTYQEMYDVLMRAALEFDIDLRRLTPFYLPTQQELHTWLEQVGFSKIEIAIEKDESEDPLKLYHAYASASALSYLDMITESGTQQLKQQIIQRFLEICEEEHTPTTINIAWIHLQK
ncbi:MAG: P-loop NTPase fold protein [Coriobacteriia bacterium]|nr:P-loop NTPase fold protein [Coriobacteriia bacterium]